MSDIAIVGVDGRFPGATDPAEFWDLLMRAECATSEQAPADRAGSGGFLADSDAFDHEFFHIAPREASSMDPQQRLLLQTVWRALEDAGLDPRAQAGTRTGVFVGAMTNEWALAHHGGDGPADVFYGTGNGLCMIANRISYCLDLRGPSWTVDSACSSSLLATHQAAMALRAGDCDQAIVGGVNIILTPALDAFYQAAGLASADGECRPFSRDATGIVRGEAVAAVVLRRIEDALADGLPVYAVIKGGAVNQDGRSNGLTAPNRWAQRAVLTEAYHRAGVRPEQVLAVEAHGTGTTLGDMIEANALGDVHGVPRAEFCALGSVKGNIGHTEGAAGIAALIKMMLALHHGVVPPTRHTRTENLALTLGSKGLRLAAAPVRLRGQQAAVGVSSFGLGGTNVHLVLGKAPMPRPGPEASQPGILTLSADNPTALRRNAAQLAAALAGVAPRDLGSVCWTSNRVKASGRHRMSVVATDLNAGVAAVAEFSRGTDRSAAWYGCSGTAMSIAWSFAGRGWDADMVATLRRRFEAFERAYCEAADHLQGTADEVFAAFTAEFALGRLLSEAGVRPDRVTGTGVVGEVTAAVTAGRAELRDAAFLLTPDAEAGAALIRRGSAARTGAPTHLVHIGSAPVADGPAANEATRIRIACGTVKTAETDVLEAVARLYRDGLDIEWSALYEPDQRQLYRLRPYRFSTESRFRPTPRPTEGRHSPRTIVARSRPPVGVELSSAELSGLVCGIVAEIGGHPVEAVTTDTRLSEDLGFDSVMAIQLQDRLAPYGRAPVALLDLLDNVRTVGDLMALLQSDGLPVGR